MTTRLPSAALLHAMLEESFAVHTTRLTALTVCRRLPGRGGYEPRTLAALIDHHQRGVADTAHALRRMADGSYGTCQACGRPIPLGRLRLAPHAARCAPCLGEGAGSVSVPRRAGTVLGELVDHQQ